MAIERINSRLRHWFARFRRRTCVVSEALEMVDATIALFAAYHVNGNGQNSLCHCLLNTLTLSMGSLGGGLKKRSSCYTCGSMTPTGS